MDTLRHAALLLLVLALIAIGAPSSAEPGMCGDSVPDEPSGEQCDDGNTITGDGCRGDCLGSEVCGDGLEDVAEECDDGNTTSGDGCSAGCEDENCADHPCGEGEVLLCHCPPGNPANQNQKCFDVSSSANHLANHPFDTCGLCADGPCGGF